MLCENDSRRKQLSVLRNDKFGNELKVVFNKMCILALLLIEMFRLALFCSSTDTESRRPRVDSIVKDTLFQTDKHISSMQVHIFIENDIFSVAKLWQQTFPSTDNRKITAFDDCHFTRHKNYTCKLRMEV